MNHFISFLWYFFQVAIGYNLVMPLLLFIIYQCIPKNRKEATTSSAEADYAVIVTAYEQTDLLPNVVKSLLEMRYDNYLIYIVADKCDISQLHFDSEKVVLLRPEETLASNTRSHFYAINRFKRPHERLTIIDSDNIIDPDYLQALNVYFDKGFKAVQGLRDAKNIDTTVAALDAARDIYYHYYDGKLLFEVGSSATLSGSGMAFTVSLYKSCLEHLDITGAGFDKILQKQILSAGERIAFQPSAIVYDEKTSRTDQLVNQRARWINTWFRYFSFGFGLIGKGIRNVNWNQFLFGLILVRPPLFIFLLLSVLLMGINLFVDFTIAVYWFLGFLAFILSFLLALLNNPTPPFVYRSLWGIPKFIFYQVISLVKARTANKRSVATKHYHKK
ncbi:MAG: glycosyltransferase [Sediminibacterium sp.]|nr:glycosyltransferase [Chitinophagaceae bacterium]MCA6447103.1 glycosyltransferase [Chitinophagaceae bacterium]